MRDEVLQKVLTADTTVIPRYDILLPDGTKVAENVRLVLKNTVLTVGTALNKQTLLKDTTATAYNLVADTAVPDDVFLAVRRATSYCPKIKVRALAGTVIYVKNIYNGQQFSYTVDFTNEITIDVMYYSTYKIWGILNGVRTADKYIDIDTTKTHLVDIGSLVAYVKVSTPEEIGATVYARITSDGVTTTLTGIVKSDKTCTLPLFKTGQWAIWGSYGNGESQTIPIDVTTAMNGTTESKTLLWTKVVVSVDSGSAVTITSGSTTISGESIGGNCTFWVPTAGIWNVTATLNGKTGTATAYATTYETVTVSIRYA